MPNLASILALRVSMRSQLETSIAIVLLCKVLTKICILESCCVLLIATFEELGSNDADGNFGFGSTVIDEVITVVSAPEFFVETDRILGLEFIGAFDQGSSLMMQGTAEENERSLLIVDGKSVTVGELVTKC